MEQALKKRETEPDPRGRSFPAYGDPANGKLHVGAFALKSHALRLSALS